jgi:hypothetical protein
MLILEYINQLQVIQVVNEEENQQVKIVYDLVEQITLVIHLEVFESD